MTTLEASYNGSLGFDPVSPKPFPKTNTIAREDRLASRGRLSVS